MSASIFSVNASSLHEEIPLICEQHAWDLHTLYRQMLRLRFFDALAIYLHRIGKIGTFPSMLGQEAYAIAIHHCLHKEDVFAPYYRDHGTLMLRGVPPENILLYWAGFQINTQSGNDFPICIPIGNQCAHAVGAAYALKQKGSKQLCISSIGDGGTSRGDFYESMNAAALYELPLIMMINNNQWAISTQRNHQTHAKTLAQKGLAGGLNCYQVDGNDCLALIQLMKRVKAEALTGKPSLVEAITYRLHDHTTIDDANAYRQKSDLIKPWKHEPLLTLRRHMEQAKSKNEVDACIQKEEHDAHAWQQAVFDRFMKAREEQPYQSTHQVSEYEA